MCMVEMEEPKMHKIHRKHQLSAVIGMLALCIIAAGALWAQGRGYRQAGTGAPATSDPLAILKQSLNKAGATALDSSQEAALNTLITNFRNAHQPGAPDPAEQTARDAYINAILAKDAAAAISAADNLASLLSTRQRTMMEAETGFQIQALSVLNSDQEAALQSTMGNNGVMRALQSLSGRGPGFGRGMMDAGQMRPGTAR
jgi:Spy/CpxP family protein refolding chaperone